MKNRFIVLFTLFFCQGLFATTQSPDIIIYNETKYSLHSNPLESFFEENPNRRPESKVHSTALWRGYIAVFEIKDNQLLLKDIEVLCRGSTQKKGGNYTMKSVIDNVFPNQKEIKIDWFTGLLVIPQGHVVDYVHMGYASTYEKYILLEIDKGDLKKELKLNAKDYEKFKEEQFQAFKKTKEYEKMKEELMKDSKSTEESIERFLKIFVIEYSSKILVK